MSIFVLYLLQLAVTLAICLGLAAYIRPLLRRVLVDLCGTDERAQFWTAFSNIMLVVMPLIFGLGFKPESTALEEAIFTLTAQLRWNLLGFILSLVAIGFAVSFFILAKPREMEKA